MSTFRNPIEMVSAGEPLPDPLAIASLEGASRNLDTVTKARLTVQVFSDLGRVSYPAVIEAPWGLANTRDLIVDEPTLYPQSGSMGDLRLPPSRFAGFEAHVATVSPVWAPHGLESALRFYGQAQEADFEHAVFTHPGADQATHVLARPGQVTSNYTINEILLDRDGNLHAIVGEGGEDMADAIEASRGVLEQVPSLIPPTVLDPVVAYLKTMSQQPPKPQSHPENQ